MPTTGGWLAVWTLVPVAGRSRNIAVYGSLSLSRHGSQCAIISVPLWALCRLSQISLLRE